MSMNAKRYYLSVKQIALLKKLGIPNADTLHFASSQKANKFMDDAIHEAKVKREDPYGDEIIKNIRINPF